MSRGILCIEKVFFDIIFLYLTNEEEKFRKNIKQVLMKKHHCSAQMKF